jgi:DNA-binding MarR family transcriptional regulator
MNSMRGLVVKSPRWRTSREPAGSLRVVERRAVVGKADSGVADKYRNTTYYRDVAPSDETYRRLLAFRTQLRRFDQWSKAAAEEHGLTHAQHQLLLAVRGADDVEGPTIGEVADSLLVKHHTAGELVDRTQAHGLLERVRDDVDHRRVRLRLTEAGERVLRQLTDVHLAEVRRLGELFPVV